LFSQGQSGRGVWLTNRLNFPLMLRVNGPVPPPLSAIMACTGSAFLKTINALVYLNSPESRGKIKRPLTGNIFFSLPYYCAELFKQLALT